MERKLDRSAPLKEFNARPDDDLVICRCEEITRGEIRRAVHDGLWTMNEIKRETRSGMGLCQGQTCSRIVRNIIAQELGIPANEVDIPMPRNPVRPVPMTVMADDGSISWEWKG
jgi:NAD(P)H-nitrite reductase large subunit